MIHLDRDWLGKNVRIVWANPHNDWPAFTVIGLTIYPEKKIKLRGRDDGSAGHQGDYFWVKSNEIASMEMD